MTIISIDDYLTIGNGTIDSTYVAIVPSDFILFLIMVASEITISDVLDTEIVVFKNNTLFIMILDFNRMGKSHKLDNTFFSQSIYAFYHQ